MYNNIRKGVFMDYKKRITDELLKIKLEAFGVALIVGPKGCGKTTTAKQIANTIIEFEDENFKRKQGKRNWKLSFKK